MTHASGASGRPARTGAEPFLRDWCGTMSAAIPCRRTSSSSGVASSPYTPASISHVGRICTPEEFLPRRIEQTTQAIPSLDELFWRLGPLLQHHRTTEPASQEPADQRSKPAVVVGGRAGEQGQMAVPIPPV